MAISVSQAFKDAMQAPVKVIQATIVTDEQTFTSADYLTNLSIEASGYYFGATTKALEFSLLGTTYNLLNKAINVSISVQTDASNDTWEHCNLGNFYIYEQEVKLEKETTTFKAYDKVGMMAKEYYTGGGFTFPCTVANLAEQFQSKFGLSFTPETLVNGNYQITEDLYAKINNITYRDILAELAGATASIVAIDGVANTLTFRETPRTAIETWTYDNLKSIKLEPKYGTINAVTLSRAPEEDNISVIDEPVIQDEGTELEFEDVSRFKDVTLKGESEQATTAGKQLVQYNDTFRVGTKATGITPTVLSDGTLQVVTASGNGNWHTNWWNESQTFDTIEDTLANGDTFTIAFTIKKSSGSTGIPKVYMKDSMGYKQMLGTISTTEYSQIYYTGTWNDTGNIRIHIGWGDCVGTFTIKNWMINKGARIPYEEYTGGIASPNPDYPQEIKTVTGRQVISITGKNLINNNVSFPFTTNNGLTVDRDSDGWITIDGTATSNSNIVLSTDQLQFLQPYSGKQCTLSFQQSGEGRPRNFGLKLASGSDIFVASNSDNPHTGTLDLSNKGSAVWLLWTNTNDTFTNYKIRPQLELGSTATEFEPYSHQDFEINLGKNLFDKSNADVFNGFVNGNTGVLTSQTNNQKSVIIPIQPNTTYTIHGIKRSSNSGRYISYPTAGSSATGWYVIPANGSLTFTSGKNDHYFVAMYDAENQGYTYNTLQIEKGSVATSYAPYFEPIKLYEIGTYRDQIYHNNSQWFLRKVTTEFLINENSSIYSTGSSFEKTVRFRVDTGLAFQGTNGLMLCDRLPVVVGWNNDREQIYTGYTPDSKFYPFINKSRGVTDVETFKTWLTSHPILCYAVLATAIDTEITNPDLIAQLNAVLEAELPSETNFVTSSGDLTAYLDIEAYKKVEVKEIKLANNEILDDDRESTIMPILNSVSGFEFYPFEATTEGHGWHECGDQVAVTDGTNTWDVVINYIKLTIDGGIKETIKGIRPTETQTNYALAGGIMKTIYNTEIKVDKQGQEITSIVSRQDSFEDQTLENFSQVVQNINSVTTTIQTTGGGNLLHNSVGYNINTDKTLVSWTQSGSISSESSPESLSYGAISGSQINLGASSSITQRITVDNSGSQLYTLGFKVKKGATGVVTVHLRNNIDDYTVVIPEGSAILWKNYSIVGVLPHSSYFDVVVETNNAVSSLSITDMMLSVGDTTIPWVSASDEILSKNVAVDSSGVTVRSNATNDYTQLNELGLNGYSDASGSMENVFTVNRDTTEVSKLKARKQISMPPIKIVPVTSGNRAGWGFVKGE